MAGCAPSYCWVSAAVAVAAARVDEARFANEAPHRIARLLTRADDTVVSHLAMEETGLVVKGR